MTINRIIAVRFPFKMSQWCTPRRVRISIAIICIVAVFYTLPYLFISGMVNGTMCSATKKKTLFAQTFSWVNLVVTSAMPFCILLTMNGIIIKTIHGREKLIGKVKLKHVTEKSGKNQEIPMQNHEIAMADIERPQNDQWNITGSQ